MSDTAVTTLLIRYADGRPLCNCRQAYESSNKVGDHWWTCRGVDWSNPNTTINPNMGCGCQAAQHFAAEYIAKRALEEIVRPTP